VSFFFLLVFDITRDKPDLFREDHWRGITSISMSPIHV